MCYSIPSCTFKEHSIAETSIFGSFSYLVILNFIVYLELEGELVNSDLAFSRVVLECGSKEGLWEEEPRDPERGRSALVNP